MAHTFGGIARALGVGLAAVAIVCPVCVFGVSNGAAQSTAPPLRTSAPLATRVPTKMPDTATVRLHISGMTCGTCPVTARVALRKVTGVYSATVTLDDSLGVVRFNPRKASAPEIAARLTKLTGYGARILEEPAASRR